MRCRWIVAVAAVAVALQSGAAVANHLGSGWPHHHHYGLHRPSGLLYIPVWAGPFWYGDCYGRPYVLPPFPAVAPVARNPAPAPNLPAQRKPPGGAAAAKGKKPAKKDRVSNAAALARAKEFLKFGDEHFRAQEFSDAYQRYKKAASAAPDLADAYFRQGFSLLALGSYPSACKAFLRGLKLKPDWAESKFRLDDLYGANRLAKTNQLDQLAEAAGNEPHNAKLMFLLGIELFFDGQGQRARKFFVRAGDLGEDKSHLAGFFEALGPVPEPPAPKRDRRLEL
jgi:tetratricopeptide (TPR) repeat protein